MEQIFEAICNSIYLILEAISKFDITKVDTQRLAIAGQLTADAVRIVYRFIDILIVIFQK